MTEQFIELHTEELFRGIFTQLTPTEDITLVEWADKYRQLPSESSAEPGQWQTSRTPYLKKIMECLSSEKVREVSMMSCVQVGKSEFLLNAMGFFAHIRPTTVLMVQPTVKTGERFSKERIAPTIRDTPILRTIFSPEKSRDARNTIMQKMYPGGYLAIVGANSPADLASRPVEVVLADEVDRWPESAKTEGDPLTIVEKRTST
jgi:phage terminase large subunit GpA-like protein